MLFKIKATKSLPYSCSGGVGDQPPPHCFFYITKNLLFCGFWNFPQAQCLNDYFFLLQTKSLFWPTSTCQILIKFSFLESLWHKETNCTSFAKKMQIFSKQPVKGNLHIFSFSWLKSGYLKFCKNFCIFEMAWSRAFQKCIIFHFLDKFFLQTFLLYNWILR